MWRSMMVMAELWKPKEANGELPMTEERITQQSLQSGDLPDR